MIFVTAFTKSELIKKYVKVMIANASGSQSVRRDALVRRSNF